MSPLERFLLISILFLGAVRIFIMPGMGEHAGRGMPEYTPDAVAEKAPSGREGTYDWNPASFTRRGIPSKLTLSSDGRVPDTMRLTDTQKAFVYAAMIETYASLLQRAHEDCDTQMRRDIVRWRARQAQTIADASDVLDLLSPSRNALSKPHDNMTAATFRKRICPTIEHYLATGAYNPHPEAIGRLAHAARGHATGR